MIWIYIIIILAISFVWALVSARKELGRPREIKKTKKFLKEKILFKK